MLFRQVLLYDGETYSLNLLHEDKIVPVAMDRRVDFVWSDGKRHLLYRGPGEDVFV